MGEAMSKVTVSLPTALVKRAKHLAVDQDRDFQQVVADALEAYLKGKRA